MRTIKFRAQVMFPEGGIVLSCDKAEGEWVYGDLHLQSRIPHIHSLGKKYPINPGTVGQFAGLYDKDGREIYEGDIIISEELKHTCHYVRYMESEAMFVAMIIGSPLDEYCGIRQSWIDKFSKKIIGNIHDNPELLTNK